MDDTKKVNIIKWLLLVILVLGGAYFLIPILTSIVWGTIELAVGVGVGLALIYVAPAFCEGLANLGYRLWELVIRSDPLARLRRDQESSAKEIENYEQQIAEASTGIKEVKSVINSQSNLLPKDKIQEYQEQLKEMEGFKVELISRRDEMITAHEEFCKAIEMADAEYKVGKSFASAAKAFSFRSKSGAKSRGAQVAFDEVNKQLSNSHEKLQIAMSRPKLLMKKE